MKFRRFLFFVFSPFFENSHYLPPMGICLCSGFRPTDTTRFKSFPWLGVSLVGSVFDGLFPGSGFRTLFFSMEPPLWALGVSKFFSLIVSSPVFFQTLFAVRAAAKKHFGRHRTQEALEHDHDLRRFGFHAEIL
jgi:hypothetical protein